MAVKAAVTEVSCSCVIWGLYLMRLMSILQEKQRKHCEPGRVGTRIRTTSQTLLLQNLVFLIAHLLSIAFFFFFHHSGRYLQWGVSMCLILLWGKKSGNAHFWSCSTVNAYKYIQLVCVVYHSRGSEAVWDCHSTS